MDFATSKTKENLAAAFAGESQATNKYSYFASQARNEGYQQIAAIFEETSGNEREHAKMWFKALCNDGDARGNVPVTLDNLAAAAAGENEEWTSMYKEFAEVATEEGFKAIAALFEQVGAIEKEHEERYRTLIARIEAGEVFKRGEVTMWKCRNCGHIHVGVDVPDQCTVCAHPQAYFELRAENY
ncbi:MAG: rubrerythrin family protein [Coriobacteriales bacterium]|jgi:rubrerythrin|nr:rubrerythrin family protein [Coriobacteriales bacterium]